MDLNIFSISHVLFMIYVFAVPIYSKSPQLLFLHAWILFLLLIHWVTNDDVCVLTEIEQYCYPNKKRQELFTNRLIGKVYKINNQKMREITTLLLLFTIYRFLQIHQTGPLFPFKFN